MHELSLAERLWSTTKEVAKTRNLKTVSALKISIGECLAVSPESLVYCWEAITKGTLAEGSKLEFEVHGPSGVCKDCGKETPLEKPLYSCKACGSSRVDFKTGQEFFLEYIEGE
ncbi:MAG: hydrogenase maturation nickel metallochaperone HypA [Candidatus Omnitrophica bacterium]|nr:hydrogenase maturation nickel metallochaperone HypA [Candidatus Omnitrophota bacterium]